MAGWRGWKPGQLEALQKDAEAIAFAERWLAALRAFGIYPTRLSYWQMVAGARLILDNDSIQRLRTATGG